MLKRFEHDSLDFQRSKLTRSETLLGLVSDFRTGAPQNPRVTLSDPKPTPKSDPKLAQVVIPLQINSPSERVLECRCGWLEQMQRKNVMGPVFRTGFGPVSDFRTGGLAGHCAPREMLRKKKNSRVSDWFRTIRTGFGLVGI